MNLDFNSEVVATLTGKLTIRSFKEIQTESTMKLQFICKLTTKIFKSEWNRL